MNPSKFYLTRITIGCGNENCTNNYCQSNPIFQLTEDPITKSEQLARDQIPLCTLKCDAERFKSLSQLKEDKLIAILEEIFSNDQTIINCFSHEGKFNIVKAAQLADDIFKFKPQFHETMIHCYEKIIACESVNINSNI